MHQRTGLLLAPVWLEEDSGSDGLRARITKTVDLLEGAGSSSWPRRLTTCVPPCGTGSKLTSPVDIAATRNAAW